MLLTELQKGQLAKITEIDNSVFKDKLMEMGCIPSAVIKLQMKAPLGDPLAFELEGYILSMRKHEAETIKIEPIDRELE